MCSNQHAMFLLSIQITSASIPHYLRTLPLLHLSLPVTPHIQVVHLHSSHSQLTSFTSFKRCRCSLPYVDAGMSTLSCKCSLASTLAFLLNYCIQCSWNLPIVFHSVPHLVLLAAIPTQHASQIPKSFLLRCQAALPVVEWRKKELYIDLYQDK